MPLIRLAVVLLAAGCGQLQSVDAGDASCCRNDGFTMEMSWACYCATTTCNEYAPTSSCRPNLETTVGCGFTVQIDRGGSKEETSVFDDAGVLVGYQLLADTKTFSCSRDDPNAAIGMRAGIFPDCASAVMCACVDGGVVCP